jgi:hypothetical protein
MFKLLGVTLLQPEPMVAARLPGGAEALAALVQVVQGSLLSYYADSAVSASRTLTIAIGPQRRLQLWLSTDEGVPADAEHDHVQSLANRLTAPEVQGGPIALALVFTIGSEPPPESALAIPDEWRSIAQASDTALSIDQILLRVWSLGPN